MVLLMLYSTKIYTVKASVTPPTNWRWESHLKYTDVWVNAVELSVQQPEKCLDYRGPAVVELDPGYQKSSTLRSLYTDSISLIQNDWDKKILL